MFHRLNLISDNAKTDVSYNSDWFSDDTASQVATALEKNDILSNFDISMVELSDSQFKMIAESLLKRKIGLNKLDISFNDLTAECQPLLEKLISTKKILELNIFANHPWTDDISAMQQLAKLARDRGVKINNENTLTLQYPDIYPSKNPKLAALFQPNDKCPEILERKDPDRIAGKSSIP